MESNYGEMHLNSTQPNLSKMLSLRKNKKLSGTLDGEQSLDRIQNIN